MGDSTSPYSPPWMGQMDRALGRRLTTIQRAWLTFSQVFQPQPGALGGNPEIIPEKVKNKGKPKEEMKEKLPLISLSRKTPGSKIRSYDSYYLTQYLSRDMKSSILDHF